MPTGFIYVVSTVTADYQQLSFSCVPSIWEGRLYFAACKVPMRPKMKVDDWIFGVSPSATKQRRIVFVAQIDEVMTFAEAYRRFPALRGPDGPNPVRPVKRPGLPWPHSDYEPIEGSSHENRWDRDLAKPELDRFFVCRIPNGFRNRWLGAEGPVVDPAILGFFNRCPVFGQSAGGRSRNTGTPTAPIAHGHMYRGLHLETPEPETLIGLCEARLTGPLASRPQPPGAAVRRPGGCGDATHPSHRRGPSRC